MREVLYRLMLATLIIFAPIKATLLSAFALAMADMVIGILAAKKRKETITSAGLRRTISKVFVYELVIMMGFIVETYLVGDLFPLVKILAGLIGLSELKSALENLEEITGIPLLKLLVDKLTNMEKQ